jgi:hypothetical protein
MTRQMAMVGFLQAQNCRDILLHRICLLVALRSYAENDAQRPLLEVRADSHVGMR